VRAVILAAGYATRLHPYTRLYPKTLLRVGGRPLLDATVEALAAAPGIEDLTLVTNSPFAAFFDLWRRRSGAAGLRPVTVLDDGTTTNETRRGSIGDLLFAMDRLGLDDDLLVVCSDKLFSFSIPAFLAFARAKGGGANTCEDVGDPAKLAGRHGCVVLAPDGRITEFLEKPARPPTSVESIAFYAFPRSALPLIREYTRATGRPDAPGTMMEWLVARAPFYGWLIDGDCVDVGDPASYREADRIAWERRGNKVKKAAAIEVLLDGRELDEDALARMLDRLEAEPAVTMVHLAVASADLQRAESWVAAHPHLLPVDALEASLPPAELARGRRCSRVIPLEASAAEVTRLLRSA
jgi:glucose-1-phosphate thymidylyltransferase